jgi:hypothetical protein
VHEFPTTPNHIRDENALPGTTALQLDGPISDDASGQIQGYASLTSVDQGDMIDLHITVSCAWDVGHSRSGSSVCQAARLHPWSEGCRPGDSVGRVLG